MLFVLLRAAIPEKNQRAIYVNGETHLHSCLIRELFPSTSDSKFRQRTRSINSPQITFKKKRTRKSMSIARRESTFFFAKLHPWLLAFPLDVYINFGLSLRKIGDYIDLPPPVDSVFGMYSPANCAGFRAVTGCLLRACLRTPRSREVRSGNILEYFSWFQR